MKKDLKQLEEEIYEYLKERRWHKLVPANVAKSISIESAELLELFQWENIELNVLKKDSGKKLEIQKELADIMIYSIMLAVLLGIDTEQAILQKLEHIRKKYPAELMRNTGKPGTGAYWDIKKKAREIKKLS